MNSTLSLRDRHVLTGGALVLLAITLLGRGVPALLAWTQSQRAAALAASTALEQLHQANRTIPITSQLRALVERRLADYDSALLVGSTPANAGAELAQILGDAASVSEVQLGSVQLSADSVSRNLLAHARARATLSGDLQSISIFLEVLEEGPPLVAVRELALTAAQPTGRSSQRETLQAEVVVEGVFKLASTEEHP